MGVRLPNHCIRLNREVKEDRKTWLSFLLNFNERYFFLDDLWLNSSKLNLFTDASGAHGFGAIFGSYWCYGKWPANWEYQNIAVLEFYPIVLSLFSCHSFLLSLVNTFVSVRFMIAHPTEARQGCLFAVEVRYFHRRVRRRGIPWPCPGTRSIHLS